MFHRSGELARPLVAMAPSDHSIVMKPETFFYQQYKAVELEYTSFFSAHCCCGYLLRPSQLARPRDHPERVVFALTEIFIEAISARRSTVKRNKEVLILVACCAT